MTLRPQVFQFFAICLACLCPTAANGQENLVINPGFEDPIGPDTGWIISGDMDTAFERTQTEAHTGSWSARVYNRTAQWHSLRYFVGDGLLYDGGVFDLSVWVKADNPVPQTVGLILQINDDRVSCPVPVPPDYQWCFCFDCVDKAVGV